MDNDHAGLSRAPARTRLQGLGGRQYWRSLEELSRTPEFEELLYREFPEQASEWNDEVGRRTFLKLMAASLGLAGVTGCTRPPEEKIVPYVVPPEQIVPGKPLYFATAFAQVGYGRGVVVESHMGRPTKIEGNPDHPSSRGAADAVTQASILSLWDPDRSQVVTRGGELATWGGFLTELRRELSGLQASGGRGLAILTETVTSPTLLHQIGLLLEKFPSARWHHYEPLGRDNVRAGARLAFGRPLNALYRLDRADRILTLDSNFLADEPGSLRYARDLSDRRRVRAPASADGRPTVVAQLGMSRLYAVESMPTITGAAADHRLAVPPSRVEQYARVLAGHLGLLPDGAAGGVGGAARLVGGAAAAAISQQHARWLTAAAEDLKAHRGASLIIPGPYQTPSTQALVHAMNESLGGFGQTVTFTEPVEAHPVDQLASLRQLVEEMRAGQVEVLLILGGNPLFTAPADLKFAEALGRVRMRIHHGLYEDETSFHCHWHIPDTHYLETWSDVRADDGTATIVQPLIAPLYQGRSAHHLLTHVLGETGDNPLAPVRSYWEARFRGDGFQARWEEFLRRGVVPGTAAAVVDARIDRSSLEKALAVAGGEGAAVPATPPATATPPAPTATPPAPTATQEPAGLELIIRPDPSIGDGRHSNNGWLQELPKPLTKLTWDNAAFLSPATAKRLGVASEDVVKLSYQAGEVLAPVWILPGQPEDAVTVHLGYGRERAGRIGTATPSGGGFNAYRLRFSDSLWSGRGARIEKTGKRQDLACTQSHQMIEGSTPDLLRVREIEEFKAELEGRGHPGEKHHQAHKLFSVYPDYDYSQGHRWAMQIDNNSCIGCNACVVACQAENNIPIVGKPQVLMHREMHWIRIDTYFEGKPDESPRTYFEPLPCMHCEKAPCEVVCPVGATTHSVEGLNEMTYNRCVGTRYCSNNCPYKVRRFNFLHYSEAEPAQLQLMRNPDVTVRTRGVMEKCTYCVQRINQTRIELKKLEAGMADAGANQAQLRQRMDSQMASLEPACAQACPTRAIVFGDLNWKFENPQGPEVSMVKKLQSQPQSFSLLTELNTEPRTRYLPRFRNPNPEVAALETTGAGG